MRALPVLGRRGILLGAAASALPFRALASDVDAPVPVEDAFWQLIEAARAGAVGPDGFLLSLYDCTDTMSPTLMGACLEGLESVHARIHTPQMRHAERLLYSRYDDDFLLSLTWGLIVGGRAFCNDAVRDPETMAGHVPSFLQANLAAAFFDGQAMTIGYVVSGNLYPEMPPPDRDLSDEHLRRHLPRLAAWSPTFRNILDARAMAVTLHV